MNKHIAMLSTSRTVTYFFFKVCDNSLHVNKVDIGWHHCVSLHSNLAKSVRIF